MFHRGLWNEGKKQSRQLALLAGAGVAAGGAAVAQAYVFARLVDGVFLKSLGVGQLRHWIYGLIAIMVARAAITWIIETVGSRLALAVKTDLRRRLLTHLAALGPVHGGAERTGELANLLGEGMESLDAFFARYLPQLAVTVAVPLLVLAVVAPIDGVAAIIMLATAPLIPIMMALIGRWAGELHQKRWQVLSSLSGHFLDVLKGLTTLKLFGRSREQADIIFAYSEEFRRTTMGVLRIAFLSSLTLELLSTISIALVAVTVGLKLLYAGIGFGEAFFILLLAPEFYLPFRLLGGHFHAGAAAVAAAGRIFDLLAQPVPEGAYGTLPLAAGKGITVELSAVSFCYPGRDRQALMDVSFTIPAGKRVALVGPSGAGKTTVVNLLLGFAAPARGAVRVNGQDIKSVCREDWLRNVSYIPQFPHIFAGTVADNIRQGGRGSQAKVVAAAEAAEAHAFISRLPRGYDTLIGEGGLALSGGEAQRIAIARAFYRQAAFIILDEATSGLDPRTEKAVRTGLDRLLAGRTALIIAHRLTTVYSADLIVVLTEGMVAEQGRHEELVVKEGVYSRLVGAYRGTA
ncbi:thiol reductant ABC exporter subunit CydD [Anaeroselena agilis]|uniref:Thiol reductant ABC exporter subunit CydD n=1 Tax=Anaeroselena agilis TaxID=3063788 RepID=A0ABU3NUI7_9FIRM|nr:thiol reductant ABC exporter subunit CydD [Selenomonadales bacterium 4137-cl]